MAQVDLVQSRSHLSLEQWAADDALPGEYADGHRTEEEVPTHLHEALVSWFVVFFSAWLKETGSVLGSEAKFAISPTRGRKADVSVYLEGTAPALDAALFETPPFITVEILSPSPRDQVRDRFEKFYEYAAFGVRFYWLVDPDLRIVTVYELMDGRYAVALHAREGRHELPGADGLVLDLDALWRRIDRLADRP